MQHLITAYDEVDFSSIPDNLSGTNCVRQNSRAKIYTDFRSRVP